MWQGVATIYCNWKKVKSVHTYDGYVDKRAELWQFPVRAGFDKRVPVFCGGDNGKKCNKFEIRAVGTE